MADASSDSSSHLNTTDYTADQSSSEALSAYLKHRRLPLVGAQVLRSPSGQRVVVLYGFVGSEFGKHDAVTKAHSYLADSSVPVDNRIKVKPELLSAGTSGGTGTSSPEKANNGSEVGSGDESASGASQYPGVNSYEQQPNQAQQYAQQQNAGSAISTVAPLLMLGLMALSMTSGGSFVAGPSSFGSLGSIGSSPFGSMGSSAFGAPAPYNPYPGFSSPPPYGSAVTPYGGAGSPYTSVPPTGPYGP